MEREIKFRAWHKIWEKMQYENTVPLYEVKIGLNGEITGMRSMHKPILMQYTGLKDKNGKKIYEGDIVKQIAEGSFLDYTGENESIEIDRIYTGRVCIIASKGVSMRKPQYEDRLSGETHIANHYVPVVQYRCEIIGNIHEHPNLIQ